MDWNKITRFNNEIIYFALQTHILRFLLCTAELQTHFKVTVLLRWELDLSELWEQYSV